MKGDGRLLADAYTFGIKSQVQVLSHIGYRDWRCQDRDFADEVGGLSIEKPSLFES